MNYVVLIISILIDGLIPNISLYTFHNLTYFTPLCTVVSLVFLYKDNKQFKKELFITIFLYSALYLNNLILSFILFIPIAFIIKIFKRYFQDNFITVMIQILIVIFAYEAINFVIYSLIVTDQFLFDSYIYKVSHSLLLNVIYGIFLFMIYHKRSSKMMR